MTQIVRYTAGQDTEVRFEIDPPEGFRPVGSAGTVGRVVDAVQPAVEAARDVLERIKTLQPDEVEVKFGIKVSGSAGWLVAKAAGEGNFEVTLVWRADAPSAPPAGAAEAATSAEEVAKEVAAPEPRPEPTAG
jgi:Trypsin-co-occurring domain 1